MPIFRPQRQFGQWLLRALGAQDMLTGRTIAQLDWDSRVNPTFDVGMAAGFPGLTGTAQREVYLVAGTVAAVIAQRGIVKLWAAPVTFNTSDPRTAAGVWILNWQATALGGSTWPDHILVGILRLPEGDPGAPGAPGADTVMTPIGGTELTAGVSDFLDLTQVRSPRCQVNVDTNAALPADLVPWPSRSNALAPWGQSPQQPIYVPPGRSFNLVLATVNESFAWGVTYVEAEEPVILPPFPT